MNETTVPTRREFVAGTLAAAGLVGTGESRAADSGAGVPVRPLGKTGVKVSCLCVGGYHIGAIKEEAESVRLMHAAIDEGVTFWDNAWDYHSGGSEERMGKALAGKRDKVFLMTKDCARDAKGSRQHLEDSLRRLKTDVIDLWQFHEINYDNAPDWIFRPDGSGKRAIDVAIQARKEGKIRFIGFTGHKDPRIHLKMLNMPFEWDTVQMPINVMDAHYRSFTHQVIPVLTKRGIGPIAMKSLAGGAIVSEAGFSVSECLRYALSLPVCTVVSGMLSVKELKANAAAARAKPMTEQERTALLARTKPLAGDGRYERFKSTQQFDSGFHRKQHGFG